MSRFVIGIGSQRAGSTLLHRILEQCTDIFMHPVKELHYYDTLYEVRAARTLKVFSKRQLDREWARLVVNDTHKYIDEKYRCYLNTNLTLWNKEVANVVYKDLYQPGMDRHSQLGEVTPEYMIIPAEGVRRMREDLGADSKIILLARDPVQRFISSFKLLKLYKGREYDMQYFAKDLDEVIRTWPTWMAQQDALNDYKVALKRYRNEFKNVLFMSYDQLVEEPELTYTRLQDFLETDIDRNAFDSILGHRVNAIGETGEVHPKTRKSLEKRYAKSRRFLAKSFGKGACIR